MTSATFFPIVEEKHKESRERGEGRRARRKRKEKAKKVIKKRWRDGGKHVEKLNNLSEEHTGVQGTYYSFTFSLGLKIPKIKGLGAM